ncbi:MAG: hypothetical protein AB7O49_13375 [Sphingomonadales bacterium]
MASRRISFVRHGGNKVGFYLFLGKAVPRAQPVNRLDLHDLAPNVADEPSPPRRPASLDAALRRLDDYISRDEASLARQRALLDDSEGPARTIAEATMAEYERSLEALYRRRAALLARSRS